MDSKVADEVKKHFKVADGTISLTGGAKKWKCIACKKQITGSATRLKAHLLGVSGHNVAACREVSEDAQNDTDAAIEAMQGHAAYVGKEGDFGDPMVRAMRGGMPAHQWWVMHGGEYPELQKVAIRVTAMVSSAGACERVWTESDSGVHLTLCTPRSATAWILTGLRIWCMSSQQAVAEEGCKVRGICRMAWGRTSSRRRGCSGGQRGDRKLGLLGWEGSQDATYMKVLM